MITANSNDEFYNISSVMNNDKKCGTPGGEILRTVGKSPIYRDEATHCFALLILSIFFSHIFFIKNSVMISY